MSYYGNDLSTHTEVYHHSNGMRHSVGGFPPLSLLPSMPNGNVNYKLTNMEYSSQNVNVNNNNVNNSQMQSFPSWMNFPPPPTPNRHNMPNVQPSCSLPNLSVPPPHLSSTGHSIGTIRQSMSQLPSQSHNSQSSQSSSKTNESTMSEDRITSPNGSPIQLTSVKLEGYVAGGHVSPIDNAHDEQIVVVDDDQYEGQALQMAALRDLRQMADYGSSTLRDAMASIGFQRSVTSQLLCRPGMDSVDMEERSPSPVAVRAPIKRDRSEIGKKMHCLVCETLTTGFHFGAVSCAACSAFFRRTIAERREYSCRKEGTEHLQCPINSEQRCYCRACRLQKCLRVGMDPLAVQPHRDNIGQKRKSSSVNVNTPPPNQLKNGHWQQQGNSPPPEHVHESLVDHLNMNRKVATSMKRATESQSPSEKKKISATAQLLTSTNAFAEQLLAFSRTPVISSKRNSSSPKSATNTERLFARTTTENRQIQSECPLNNPPPPAQQSVAQSMIEERKPPAIQQNSQMVDTEEDYIVYEYEEELGGDPINRVDLPAGTMSEFPEGRSDSRNYNPADNLVEQMVIAYQQLTERRRLMYCPGTIRDILSGTPPLSRPAGICERMQKPRLRVEVGLVAEFLSVITPFAEMDLEDKIAVFKALTLPYSILEKHYVTMKKGGLQQNRIIHNDNSYIDLSDNAEILEILVDGKPDDKVDKDTLKKPSSSEEAKELFINPLRESLNEITGAMFNMKMTDVEFCSLIAVLLFDPATPGLSDATRNQVKVARDRVYHDWFSYYKSRGIHDASQKVGNTMLLLPAVQATVEKSQENYHLIRVFDLFEYDKILDEMML